MFNSTALRAPSQRRTARKPVPADYPLFSWLMKPIDGLGWLQIRDTVYAVRECPYEESDGTPRLLLKLRKADGTEHQITPTADGPRCDCQWATYKPVEEGHKACRHIDGCTAAYAALARQSDLDDFLTGDLADATADVLAADAAVLDALDRADAIAAGLEGGV